MYVRLFILNEHAVSLWQKENKTKIWRPSCTGAGAEPPRHRHQGHRPLLHPAGPEQEPQAPGGAPPRTEHTDGPPFIRRGCTRTCSSLQEVLVS
jgi:hypothetical protein